MAERHGEILAELSQLGLALARDLQARALAAGDDAAAGLGLAFHRVSRSVRQSLALEARLAREHRRGEREAADLAARESLDRLRRRRARVRVALTRAIWDEAEGDEAETLLAELEGRLAEEALDDDFATGAVEAHIARLHADLGLAAPDPAPDVDQGGPDAEAIDADDVEERAGASGLRAARPLRRAHDDPAGDGLACGSPAWARRLAETGWRSSA